MDQHRKIHQCNPPYSHEGEQPEGRVQTEPGHVRRWGGGTGRPRKKRGPGAKSAKGEPGVQETRRHVAKMAKLYREEKFRGWRGLGRW